MKLPDNFIFWAHALSTLVLLAILFLQWRQNRRIGEMEQRLNENTMELNHKIEELEESSLDAKSLVPIERGLGEVKGELKSMAHTLNMINRSLVEQGIDKK